ncbi:MAG: universal stress protein [Paracoccaceae bacterium]|nr:universal stress protein [Paracoccaceae bacterium]
MSYKTILTILTDASQMPQLDAAASLAVREDAHLDVLCLGLDMGQPGYFFPGGTAYVLQDAIDSAMAEAADLEARVRRHLAPASDLRWSVDSAVAQSGGIAGLVGLKARFSDLTVLGSPYAPGSPGDAEIVLEAALFDGGCPVLVVPASGLPAEPPQRILLAWNQSVEALAATRRALPLLRAARAVEIACIDPRRSGAEGPDPGAALCQMLTRHGVKAEIAVLARTAATISDELNRRAIETGADMIVMGAYGHSRLRQAILGGATRNMLEKSAVPVFMAR